MLGYSYSVFSAVAMAIHLIINFNMMIGRRGLGTMRGVRYRGFLFGVLSYYAADARWGVLAGLGWTRSLDIETAFFFLSLVAFVFLWGRFAVVYLGFGKRATRFLDWCGYALLALNLAAIAVNPFSNCFYYIDANGQYLTGPARDVAFVLLIAFNGLGAAFALVKAVTSIEALRRRSMMVLISYVTISTAIVLQIVWPLTPFTALGCLIVNCFFQVFVVQDEQAEKHEAELEKALARARAAEKARSLFFSIVSHDIRTPLNAILGYAELLQNGIEGEADRAMALKSIRASGTTLLQLVDDVLDLAKMDSGELAFQPEPVRLSTLVDEVLASFKLVAAEKGVELVNKTAGVSTLLLDGHRFRQILFNLVGNAVKFTKKGHIEIRASFAPDASGGKGTFRMEVEDTGCGICEADMKKLAHPFVQLGEVSAQRGGTGLGLHICRLLARAMGGDVEIKSAPGKGSTFSIVVPGVKTAERGVESGEDNSPVHPLTKSQTPNSSLKVLVADDTKMNQIVLRAMFAKLGVTDVMFADNGREALDILTDSDSPKFDFVLTDMWMPEMDGLKLVSAIRSTPPIAKMKVYLFTAEVEMKDSYAQSGFDGILLKPANLEALKRLLP